MFNNFISTIQPISNTSTAATTNTIFINQQTEDSHKLDWGDLFWGDGPESWDDSALMIQTGATTYEYSDWTSANWERRSQTQSLHPTGTGHNFTDLLCVNIKKCQQRILKRANFKTANSPNQLSKFGYPFFVNPIGAINDTYTNADGSNPETQYMFRRGKFNMALNEWDGEWIETTIGDIAASSSSFKIGGGTNLTGKGSTLSGFMNQRGSVINQRPQISLAVVSEIVVKDVAITSLTIQNDYDTGIQDATDLPIGSAFSLKENDMVYMVYKDGKRFELTLTADVTAESTSIQFLSITPDTSSLTFPSIQIPILKLYENMFRKTDGKIAGFDVNATSLTKGGISINGFLDSDTMTGASATTLATTESIKAYVDAQASGGGLVNFSRFTTSGTALTSATNGEAQAVVIPFDTEVKSSINTIAKLGSAGISPAIPNSVYAFTFGGTPPSGYFELTWNIATDTSVTNNRILAGVKLQNGIAGPSSVSWADVSATHSYIYNRGSGFIREGSCSGGALIRMTGLDTQYFRLVVWKEASSSVTTKAITLINGCQIMIKELTT